MTSTVKVKGAKRNRTGVALGALAGALIAVGTLSPRASAVLNPAWHLNLVAPTYFVSGGTSSYEATATNVGTSPAGEVTITENLPTGVKFKSAAFYWWRVLPGLNLNEFLPICSESVAQQVTCSFPFAGLFGNFFGAPGGIQPGEAVQAIIEVTNSSSAEEATANAEAVVEGSGAGKATASSHGTITSHPLFGVAKFSMQTTETVEENVGGQPLRTSESWGFENRPVGFTQAGGHPQALTTVIEFNSQDVNKGPNEAAPLRRVPVGDARDVVVDIPPGLLGNPNQEFFPRCPIKTVTAGGNRCPATTQVGIAKIDLLHGEAFVAPIVNTEPEKGQSAEFGVETNHEFLKFLLTAHVVHVGGSEAYGLTVVSNSTPMAEIVRIETTFWGVPSAKIHDPERGLVCGRINPPLNVWQCEGGNAPNTDVEYPFLTWPSDCSEGPGVAHVRTDSWEEPAHRVAGGGSQGYAEATSVLRGVTGCNLLSFAPTIEVKPDKALADEPVGLGVDLNVPQVEKPEVSATPEVRKTVLSFPAGLSISPGIVDGIKACDESGPEGINFEGPESEEVGLNGELQLAPGHCPDASIIGTAEAVSPLLAEPVKGHIYLARPACGNAELDQAPCTEQDALDGKLYQEYLELGGTGPLANTGVNIKVRLKVQANPANGQLTAVADEIAQLPFSELKINLNGGPRAPLANPPVCGPAVTSGDFTSWAAPGLTPEKIFMAGIPDVTPESFFIVNGCRGPPVLSPGFVAGTVTANAGKFSPFTLNITRQDREQYIKGVQVHTPPGLLGVLASVPLCGETEADAGTCPEGSRIGSTRVASGAGSHPFEVEGSMYLTGPHDGAPFGLSVVTNAVAGPFNLGKVVVRARIDIDPHDSSLTITTDETGPYALPQIIFGIPLRLQRITVNVDRAAFMFNPTNCTAQQITARIAGSQDAVANVSSPFAVGGCRSLGFKPIFKVSTSAHTSRHKGASLDARVSYPKGAMGNDANIARVKVSLPRQLPSRLPTLQKACVDTVFETNPATCPKGSIVGIARTTTPLLPVRLEGPVYFISHGGAKFPDLVVVLEGDGIRVDLVGNTFISKGITSSTFNTVPDVPVNSFELYLPQGPDSALAANGNLCEQAKQLVMPTEFVAQNGKVFKQKTKISVTGCGKANKRRKRPGKKRARVGSTTRGRGR